MGIFSVVAPLPLMLAVGRQGLSTPPHLPCPQSAQVGTETAASPHWLDMDWHVFCSWALSPDVWMDGCLSSAIGTWPLYDID